MKLINFPIRKKENTIFLNSLPKDDSIIGELVTATDDFFHHGVNHPKGTKFKISRCVGELATRDGGFFKIHSIFEHNWWIIYKIGELNQIGKFNRFNN